MEKDIKEMLGHMLTKLDGLESRMGSLETKIGSMESKIGSIESKLGSLESRQDEIFYVVKAIEHNNLVHGAEIDNLKFKSTHIEGTINAVGNIITSRMRYK